MDFHHQYFSLNKFLLSTLGFWPYQSKSERIARQCVLFLVWGGNVPALMRRFYIIWGNMDEMIDCTIIATSATLSFMKLVNSLHKKSEIKNLLGHIKSDWHLWSSEPEIRILEKYAEEGRKLTLLYTVATYCSVVSYLTFTLSPRLLNIIMPISNGTRPTKYPLPEDFGIDPEKYFYLIFLYGSISLYANFTILVSVDSMYVVFVQHVCGIFSAIGQRLENIITNCEKGENIKTQETNIFREIFFCIKQHNSALKYADDIQKTYATYFFFLLGINMLILTFTGVQIVIKLGNFDDVVKFTNYTLLLVVHLLYNSMPGQKIMDHSTMISQSAYNSNWFEMPRSAEKALLFMIIRSSKPCKITAGKFYIMSMQSFSVVIRTAMSYFTVLLSMT